MSFEYLIQWSQQIWFLKFLSTLCRQPLNVTYASCKSMYMCDVCIINCALLSAPSVGCYLMCTGHPQCVYTLQYV